MNNAPANFDCPPLMADGRHVTDYRPSCVIYQELQAKNNFANSNDQRMFMQRNAKALRNQNCQRFFDRASCKSCTVTQVDPNGSIAYQQQYRASLQQRK